MSTMTYNPAYAPAPIVASQCNAEDIYRFCGEVVVGTVAVPQHVIEELRLLGISAVSWLLPGELEDAVRACSVDRNLNDNPNGHTLKEKMVCSEQDKKRAGRAMYPAWFGKDKKCKKPHETQHGQGEHEDEIGCHGLF